MFYRPYMDMAVDTASKSVDPNTKVGCVISDGINWISSGYNRMPLRANTSFPWKRDGALYETKYPYVIHAEMAALRYVYNLKKVDSAKEVYVTLFPCSNCAKALIEAGVEIIYYLEDKYAETPDIIASKRLLDGCGIKYIQEGVKIV